MLYVYNHSMNRL